MRSIEDVTSKLPYLTCPGNHEDKSNFSHYDARFSMMADRGQQKKNPNLSQRINNFFHSVDIGPVHFVMFSTEFYFFTEYGWDQIRFVILLRIPISLKPSIINCSGINTNG